MYLTGMSHINRVGARAIIVGGKMVSSWEHCIAKLVVCATRWFCRKYREGRRCDSARFKKAIITLIDCDGGWREQITVDYFDGCQGLSEWYLLVVTDPDGKPCEENVETGWVGQDEDAWYPLMKE